MSRRKKPRDIPGTLAYASKLSKGHGQFIMHLKEMRDSPAMQNMPLREWKLLLLFETTHLEKKGECNGDLILPYRQAQMAGIHKDGIGPAFGGLMKRKLLVRTREGSYRNNARSLAATYRLTYLPARKVDGTYAPPTHDWRDYKPENDIAKDEVKSVETPRRAADES